MDKGTSFADTYNMRAPCVHDTITMEAKSRTKKIHYTTPTGKFSHNNSHMVESSTNTKEANKSKEKRNKWRVFTSTVPHDGRKEHSGRQAVITNANQWITDGESKDE